MEGHFCKSNGYSGLASCNEYYSSQSKQCAWTLEKLSGSSEFLKRETGMHDNDNDNDDNEAHDDNSEPQSMQILHYKPQTEYGSSGHLICTTVCYALAHAFLNASAAVNHLTMKPMSILSVARVDACKRACHCFFEEKALCTPLMLAEMQCWFPMTITTRFPEAVACMNDVAGLTDRGPTYEVEVEKKNEEWNSMSCASSTSQYKEKKQQQDDHSIKLKSAFLIVMPLNLLLFHMQRFARQRKQRLVLIITVDGHTRMCLSAPGEETLLLFDPQSTHLKQILADTPENAMASLSLPSAMEYAGLLISASVFTQ